MMMANQKRFDAKDSAVYFEKINLLTEEATYKLDEVFSALGLRKLSKQGKMLVGSCPVHGGDRPNAFNLYPDGHTTRCVWVCRSKQCHNVFRSNLFGFIRGVLSNQRLGFDGTDKSKVYSFTGTVKWLENFLEKKANAYNVNYEEIEKKRFVKQVEALERQPFKENIGWSPSVIRSSLTIPSSYFVKRFFSQDVLTRFDVGESKKARSNLPMSERAICPVYCEDGSKIIGFTGRSLYEKCPKCELWHNPSCQCKPAAAENCKWRNTFPKENYLYGYWLSKEHIRKSKRIVLVEGPGDLWKLWQFGVYDCIALMGCQISDRQQIIIEKSGAENLISLLDNDESGQLGNEEIVKRFKNWLKIKQPKIDSDKKDIGEMDQKEIEGLLI